MDQLQRNVEPYVRQSLEMCFREGEEYDVSYMVINQLVFMVVRIFTKFEKARFFRRVVDDAFLSVADEHKHLRNRVDIVYYKKQHRAFQQ